MKNKLQLLCQQLNNRDLAHRTANELGDEPIAYPVLGDGTVFKIYVSVTEPLNMKIGDYWFNRSVIRKVTAVDPQVMHVLTEYDVTENSPYGFGTTLAFVSEVDYSSDSLVRVEVTGPAVLDPSQPNGSHGYYEMRLIRASGAYEIATRPTWSLSDASYTVETREGNRLKLVAGDNKRDAQVRVTARFTHPEFGPQSARTNVLVKGSVPITRKALEIIGPDVIDSNEVNKRYFLRVYMSDGSYFDEVYNANWSLSDRRVAQFTGDNKRETTGTHILVSSMNLSATGTFTIRAWIYSEDCSTKMEVTKEVIVNPSADFAGGIFPYYGKGAAGMRSEQFIVSLLRAKNPARQNDIELMLCPDEKGYYCYPASWGHATFTDLSNGWVGGWESMDEGAGADVFVPDQVNVVVNGEVVPFFVYETSQAGIGLIQFRVG